MRSSLRRRIYETIEPGVRGDAWSIAFDRFSILVILASVTCAVIATLPSLTTGMRADLGNAEYAFGSYFVLEYAARLWSVPEHPLYSGKAQWQARLHYAATPLMVLDAAGLVPLVLSLVAPGWREAILLFQVVRFFRLARYSPALATVGRVLASEWRPLVASGLIGLGMLLVSATTMYLLEHDAQPERFASIPDAMYWAIVTLATVGYGDVVPITAVGKIAAGGVIVMGLIFFALPVAIIATGFLAEIRRQDFLVSYGMVARVPLFSGLDAAAIAEIASMLKARKLPRELVIVRKGDEGHSMFFIVRGEAEVVLPGRSVRLHEGDFFGEMAVLGRIRRTASVIARRPCELLVLDAGDVLKIMEQNPSIDSALRAALAQRQAAQSTP